MDQDFKEKMFLIGLNNSFMTHELNEPLTLMALYLDDFEMELDEPSPNIEKLKENLEKLKNSHSNFLKITSSVKSIVQQKENDKEEVNLSQLIEDILKEFQAKAKKLSINLSYSPKLDSLSLKAHYQLLYQAIKNLLKNSFEAIQNNKEKWIKVELSKEEDFFRIDVSDSGKLESAPSAPLQSSKGKDGMGIGLLFVSEVAKIHGGQLIFENQKKHTCFSLIIAS